MINKRIIISGGGTAGHIHPAIAVSQKLKEREPGIVLTFVGTTRALEQRIMASYRAKFIPLRIEGIKGKGIKMIKSFFFLPFSFLKSLLILVRIKPNLVIGVGGYSSGPIVLLASWLKIPTLIMEQNLQPGLTNRLLRRWVEKAVVSFPQSLSYFGEKGIFIGNPVREEFYTLVPKQRNNMLTLLLFGGSQGSHFLNTCMMKTLPLLKKEKERIQIFHQTGKKDLDWMRENYARQGFEKAVVEPYFEDISNYFQKSDLIVSRAGASTIAELIASQKASVLIPFSQATDDHQVLNARELERVSGAEVITEDEFSPEAFSQKILGFLEDKEKINKMEKNLAPLKTDKVADKIVDLCIELMGKRC
jgi:UDP-N-acetylglucosamine--N-acetylmuramyl-(pentapeptide) pyrophosphoryl-undecaprenol N-acetylglucosamine transferase